MEWELTNFTLAKDCKEISELYPLEIQIQRQMLNNLKSRFKSI